MSPTSNPDLKTFCVLIKSIEKLVKDFLRSKPISYKKKFQGLLKLISSSSLSSNQQFINTKDYLEKNNNLVQRHFLIKGKQS